MALALVVGVLAFLYVPKLNAGPMNAAVRWESGPLLVFRAKADQVYRERAFSALKLQPLGRSVVSVFVYYVPPEMAFEPARVPGLEIEREARIDLRYLQEPYDGYLVVCFGAKRGEITSAQVGGRSLPVYQDGSGSSYSGVRDGEAFYDGARDKAKPIEQVYPEACSRVFKPNPGETVSNASASGDPVFEVDEYDEGRWMGSYAVWPSVAQTTASSIVLD